jgi:hypothetical protein
MSRTNPELWERIKNQVLKEETAGTQAGQWSARKAIVAVQRYKKAGGRYIGPRPESNSLRKWIKQDWTTQSGLPSHVTGERYLPRKAFKALSPREVRTINASKRRAMHRGQQYSPMPKSISRKIRPYRK